MCELGLSCGRQDFKCTSIRETDQWKIYLDVNTHFAQLSILWYCFVLRVTKRLLSMHRTRPMALGGSVGSPHRPGVSKTARYWAKNACLIRLDSMESLLPRLSARYNVSRLLEVRIDEWTYNVALMDVRRWRTPRSVRIVTPHTCFHATR